MFRQTDELQLVNRILFVLFIVCLGSDIWSWYTQPIDLNHLPFFLSGVLGASTLAFWITRRRFFDGTTNKQRDETMCRTEADSCLHPSHTHRHQGSE